MKRFLGTLAILVLLSGGWSCSEKAKAPPPSTSPVAAILYPVVDTTKVRDSIDVYVGAADLTQGAITGGVRKIQFWFVSPDTSQYPTLNTMFGESDTPLTLTQVPDPVKSRITLPPGYQLFSTRWYVGTTKPAGNKIWTYIRTGTYVQIFAVAFDAAGNQGRSSLVRLGVYNHGTIYPPNACFSVTPTTGIVGQTDFAFDASCTTDSLDKDPAKLEVRWSFSGDTTHWDLGDWRQPGYVPVHPNDIQHHTFPLPRRYVVVMQARNSYLLQAYTTVTRVIQVGNKGGTPRPPGVSDPTNPDPSLYVSVPSGVFPVGANSYVLDDSLYPANGIEQPLHYVQISAKSTQKDFIAINDVTNDQYLAYIDSALISSSYDPNNPSLKRPPQLEFQDGMLIYKDQVAPVDTTWVFMDLDRANTKIYYDLTSRTFKVPDAYKSWPVTGVSWYGAYSYALFYGLRLPSEAEWEVCARGDHPTLAYPFAGGTRLLKTNGWRKVNYRGSWLKRGGSAGPTPVSYFNGVNPNTDNSPSIYGLYDMSGNVGQWLNDWLSAYRPANPVAPGDSTNFVIDPQGPPDPDPASNNAKVIRGGSYQSSRADVRCTARAGESDLEQCFPDVGFRVAYTLLLQ